MEQVINRILHGIPLPHSFVHEGDCIVRHVSPATTCQVCGVRGRLEVDGKIYCNPCAWDMTCAEQKAAIKKLSHNFSEGD